MSDPKINENKSKEVFNFNKQKFKSTKLENLENNQQENDFFNEHKKNLENIHNFEEFDLSKLNNNPVSFSLSSKDAYISFKEQNFSKIAFNDFNEHRSPNIYPSLANNDSKLLVGSHTNIINNDESGLFRESANKQSDADIKFTSSNNKIVSKLNLSSTNKLYNVNDLISKNLIKSDFNLPKTFLITLTNIGKFLLLSEGKNKLCALLQYCCKFLSSSIIYSIDTSTFLENSYNME